MTTQPTPLSTTCFCKPQSPDSLHWTAWPNTRLTHWLDNCYATNPPAYPLLPPLPLPAWYHTSTQCMCRIRPPKYPLPTRCRACRWKSTNSTRSAEPCALNNCSATNPPAYALLSTIPSLAYAGQKPLHAPCVAEKQTVCGVQHHAPCLIEGHLQTATDNKRLVWAAGLTSDGC